MTILHAAPHSITPLYNWRTILTANFKNALPKGSEKRYHFSDFTITLNEEEPNTAPTDSRLRKDQRLMEETKWDEANTEKQVSSDDVLSLKKWSVNQKRARYFKNTF